LSIRFTYFYEELTRLGFTNVCETESYSLGIEGLPV